MAVDLTRVFESGRNPAGGVVGTTRIEGLDHLKAQLQALPKAMRVRVLRNSLAAGARIVQREAKRNAPVLAQALKSPYRKPGTVQKAISVRTSKAARRAGDVGVFVNVKPAKPGHRGAKSPNDPFYWRWAEFGWTPATKGVTKAQRRRDNKAGVAKKIAGRKFLTNAARKLPEALRAFEAGVSKWLAKVAASGKVTP